MSEIAIWQPGEVALPGQALGQVPNSQLDDWIMVADKVVRLAEVICRSPFVPDGLRGSVPATAAAILTGRELGIPPMTSLANIHVIHGKPGLSALVMRALVLSQGHEWKDVDVSNTRVIVAGRRKGEVEWTEASFTTADAATAKLTLGGYPQDKLYARATARLARRKFADVIAGMPYSIDELEDGVVPDEQEPAEAPAAPVTEQKPRTAQRRPRAQTSPPAAAVPPSAAAPEPPRAQAAAGGDLPPLPGEEEITAPVPGGDAREAEASTAGSPGPGRPEPVTPKQLTAIWTVLSDVFLFGKDERDEARKVCAHIVNRELASSKDMTKAEAGTVLDTLAHWETQAQREDESPRAYLKAVTEATAGDPRGEEGGNGGE